MQHSVDAAIIAVRGSGSSSSDTADVNLQVGLKAFPELVAPGAVKKIYVVRTYGPLFFFGAAMVHFLLTLNLLVQEKEDGLLGAMRKAGMQEGLHWLCWQAVLLVPLLLSTVLVLITGNALGLDMFTYTDDSVTFSVFFTYSLSMCAFAMCAASVLPSVRLGTVQS